MVFISNGQTTRFGTYRPSSGLKTFLLKEFYIYIYIYSIYDISTSPRGLDILYKTLLTRNLSKPEDDRHRPKHVVFPLLINTIIWPCIYSCVLTEFTSPCSLNTQRGWHTTDCTLQMAQLRWHTSEIVCIYGISFTFILINLLRTLT